MPTETMAFPDDLWAAETKTRAIGLTLRAIGLTLVLSPAPVVRNRADCR